MTQRGRRSIPDVADRFRAYHAREPVWGALHSVLDDQNVNDASVLYCIEEANRRGDTEGAELGAILLTLSKTQRIKLGRTL